MELGPMQTKWVEALESGEYRQGQQYLRQKHEEGDLFCCLGVACSLFPEISKPEDYEEVEEGGPVFYSNEKSLLPERMVKLLGFLGKLGQHKHNDTSLSMMNDNGITFKEIAEEIRKNPSNWFWKSV